MANISKRELKSAVAEFGQTPWRTVSMKVFLKETGTDASQGTARAMLLQQRCPQLAGSLQVSAGNSNPHYQSSEVKRTQDLDGKNSVLRLQQSP